MESIRSIALCVISGIGPPSASRLRAFRSEAAREIATDRSVDSAHILAGEPRLLAQEVDVCAPMGSQPSPPSRRQGHTACRGAALRGAVGRPELPLMRPSDARGVHVLFVLESSSGIRAVEVSSSSTAAIRRSHRFPPFNCNCTVITRVERRAQ